MTSYRLGFPSSPCALARLAHNGLTSSILRGRQSKVLGVIVGDIIYYEQWGKGRNALKNPPLLLPHVIVEHSFYLDKTR